MLLPTTTASLNLADIILPMAVLYCHETYSRAQGRELQTTGLWAGWLCLGVEPASGSCAILVRATYTITTMVIMRITYQSLTISPLSNSFIFKIDVNSV